MVRVPTKAQTLRGVPPKGSVPRTGSVALHPVVDEMFTRSSAEAQKDALLSRRNALLSIVNKTFHQRLPRFIPALKRFKRGEITIHDLFAVVMGKPNKTRG